METKIVVRVNKVDIISTNEGFIPIKPICQALGIAYQSQMKKIKDDEDIYSVLELKKAQGSDGKFYKMLCIPYEYIFGWMLSINPKNVNEGAKKAVSNYRKKCYHILTSYFSNNKENDLFKVINKENSPITKDFR